MCREPLSGHAVTSRIDYEVLAIDEAEPPQLVEQREMMRRVAWTGMQAADAINPPGFLRPRRERPRRRAAECGQQLPPCDGDCHTPLPREVREGTVPRHER